MIKGIMSESLHIRGIMSKEFSAIRCLCFNGSTDYVDLGLMNLGTIHSYSCWVSLVGTQDSCIFAGINGTNMNLRYGEITGCLEFRPTGSVDVIKKWNIGDITDEGWQHIMITRSGFTVKAYINGVLQTITHSTETNNIDTKICYLAKRYIHNDFYLNGKIDDVRIWDRALSSGEVTSCYKGSAPRNGLVAEWLMNEMAGSTVADTSVNSNHGTIHGADWYEEKFNTPLKGIMSNSSEIKGIMTAEYI